jgi:hypothetical protein
MVQRNSKWQWLSFPWTVRDILRARTIPMAGSAPSFTRIRQGTARTSPDTGPPLSTELTTNVKRGFCRADAILLQSMIQGLIRVLVPLVAATLLQAAAVEPLVGTWKLTSQSVNGQKADSEDLTLRVYPAGDGYEFAYSTPVNGIHLVSMKFKSVQFDGRTGSVEDVRGRTLGTVRVSKTAASQYDAVIEGPNRPKATAKMSVSSDGNTLTSDSSATGSAKGDSHVVQIFSRR